MVMREPHSHACCRFLRAKDRAWPKRLSDITMSAAHETKGLQIKSLDAVMVSRPIDMSQIRSHVICP